MLLMLILIPIFEFINWILGFLPDMNVLPTWINDMITVIGYGLQLFPQDVWIITIVNVSLWTVGLIGWSIFEWLYKKIPGVD